LHSFLAGEWWKRQVLHYLPFAFRYYRFVYSVFASCTLAAVLIYQYSFPDTKLWKNQIALVVIAIPFLVAGILIMIICIRKYFFYLSGISVFSKKQPEPVLQNTGLHRFTRHPLYLGTLLVIWSLFVLFPFVVHLVACVIITIYVLIGIRLEERKLFAEYGDAYKRYSKQVPMLIPNLFANN
jgi:protein-S-isoprenylcysteine O-methyltransferase Ste14